MVETEREVFISVMKTGAAVGTLLLKEQSDLGAVANLCVRCRMNRLGAPGLTWGRERLCEIDAKMVRVGWWGRAKGRSPGIFRA